jgi:diguanylate cyclase (GGDEF)-like protein
LTALAEPIVIAGRKVSVSASIGITVASGRNANAEVLLREADAAMYRAKRAGKARYELSNLAGAREREAGPPRPHLQIAQ